MYVDSLPSILVPSWQIPPRTKQLIHQYISIAQDINNIILDLRRQEYPAAIADVLDILEKILPGVKSATLGLFGLFI